MGPVAHFLQTYWGYIGGAATASYAIFRNIPLARNFVLSIITPIAQGARMSDYERRVSALQERGDFWERQHTDLLQRYDDLERRLREGLDELRALRDAEIRRTALVSNISAERESAYIWATALRDQLLRIGQKPEMEEPRWVLHGFNVLIPSRQFVE